jgi:Fe2+ or Zn2+ uptake regulation protein
MRPDVTDNLWFIESDGKLFIRDFNCAGGGVCCFVALNQSNENYTCKQIGKIEKITAEQATAIVKTTGTRLIFGKVETNATNGNIESFGVCV